ncbi:non-ribosomal peptide synthetase [Myxococcus sp. RHSTA-1-4]|uniref:non-ribosomal peptide synthetase n=1 Tax=Myxococcus sp. RHSTA-1-4 TaxID=2874601 RepID=UPI001CC172CE|nr:non-ribosomal peptide synthetase [Myxococcus sp. RHSTA-1-4]MBZ4417133.1 amino acid adenylation domain-containing protein [Myxococcus sp. RHSTA-1-4]
MLHPVSPGQRALWFDQVTHPGISSYHLSFALRLREAPDLEALARALQAMVDRHPMLRTTYVLTPEGLRQREAATLPCPLVRTEVGLASDDALLAEVRGAHERPFDLERGPLCRGALFSRSEREHVLLLTFHHVAVDGASLIFLYDELPRLYSAIREGRALPPANAPSYVEALRQQEALLSGPEQERLWRYWSQQLDGAPPALELPLDRPRPAARDFEGAAHAFFLPPELVSRLKVLARGERTVLQTVVLAAFQALLFRYTGQEDFVVGTPTAGRAPGFARTVGHFVNLVPLRARLRADLPFRELLAQARRTMSEALAHQHQPFPWLVERLSPRRDPSRAPLFQVSFVPQQPGALRLCFPFAPDGPLDFGGLPAEPYSIPQQSGVDDLSLMVCQMSGGLACVLRYRTSLFEAETVARMAGHLEALLEGVLAHPDAPLEALPLVSESERRALLALGTGAEVAAPFTPVFRLIDAWAEREPDAVAACRGTDVLTYGALRRRSSALATRLRALGVGREARVALWMERGPDMLVAQLAVLKAGGAFVPLEPAHPRQRLERVLALSRTGLLLTDDGLLDSAPGAPLPAFALDELEEAASREPGGASPPWDAHPEGLAYVLFTSGSTGEPKGVLGLHKGLSNMARAASTLLGMAPGQRVLQFASAAFDGALWEVFSTLVGGGTLCFASREELAPGLPLLAVLREQRITTTWLPPAVLSHLPADGLPELRTLTSAGEACTPAIVSRWAPGRTLLNSYGPTEGTVCATVGACRVGSRPPALGPPIPGARVHVLDARLQPVPRGVPGEVYAGGEGVVRGYLERPDLTAERFVPDPFSLEPGRRLYRTGDRARYTHDGELEFLGRVDRQVKIRGVRVEPGEVEDCLGRHPAVAGQVVVAREDVPGERSLVAYVAVREGAEVSGAGLRAFVAERFPEAFVPSAFVVLPRLPLTANGKVDVAALPAPEAERVEDTATFTAPRTALEGTLATLWAQMLHRTRVGVDDNFFELGGHSLLLMQVHQRLTEEHGLSVRVVDLFHFPTVASLARHLEQTDTVGGGVRQGSERGQRQRLAMQARPPAVKRAAIRSNPHE